MTGAPRDPTLPNPRFQAILLLGSYDPVTKPILARLQEVLSESLIRMEGPAIVLLLDEFEIYRSTGAESLGGIDLIVETGERRAIHSIINGVWVDSTVLSSLDPIDEAVTNLARTTYGVLVHRLPIIAKLSALSIGAPLTFLVRDQELTRGGEYIEMAFLLGLGSYRGVNRFWFIARNDVQLSTMADELLDMYSVPKRTYQTDEELEKLVLRVAFYQVNRP